MNTIEFVDMGIKDVTSRHMKEQIAVLKKGL